MTGRTTRVFTPVASEWRRHLLFAIHQPLRMGDLDIIGSASASKDGCRQIENGYNSQRELSDRSFRFEISVVESGAWKLHSHEYSELAIALGGRGVHLSDGAYPVEHGEVVVTPGGQPHGWSDPQHLRLCQILYDPRSFFAEANDLYNLAGFRALFDWQSSALKAASLHRRLRLPAEDLVYVMSLLSALQTEYAGRMPGRQTIIKSTFLLLVTYLSRVYARQTTTAVPGTGRMTSVIAHIREHFREPLAIEELARLAHLSPSQFHRNFKRAYNTTPIHFVTHLRLHQACDLLKDADQDITNIALETGFSSSSFFSTQFKRYMGESPSDYRRKRLTQIQPAT